MALTSSNLQYLPETLSWRGRVELLLGQRLLGSRGEYGYTMEFRLANDGYIYTKQEFCEHYDTERKMGSCEQWNRAIKVTPMEKHEELLRRIRKGAANVRSSKLTVPVEIQSHITTFLYDATG